MFKYYNCKSHKNPELRFCKCGKSESRIHYIFYCDRFTDQRNLLHDQINQISENFIWDDLNIFEILGGSQFDIDMKICIEERVQTYCLNMIRNDEYMRDYKFFITDKRNRT